MRNKQKFLNALLERVQKKSLYEAVEQMWNEGLLNLKKLERLYIVEEVGRRVRVGETKIRAIEQLSEELNCSYEKIRAAVYQK